MKADFLEGYNNKLKSKLFGLLCEFEKNGEWEKFLDSIIIALDFNLSLIYNLTHNLYPVFFRYGLR